MNKPAFYCLFVNANCLTELGLRNMSTDLDSLLDDLEPIDAAQLDAELPTQLDDLNFDVVEGLEFYDAAAETSVIEPEPESLPIVDEQEGQIVSLQVEPKEPKGEFDINTYMVNAYSHEEHLSERVGTAFQQSDQQQLESLLRLVPSELPSFTEKLSGEQMTLWLHQYSNDLESIMNLLIAIRQLDFS